MVRGLRTLPHLGRRAEIATALSVVAGQPRLWLMGMIGFALRGGILLLVLPIVVLPTQVEVRFMLGDNLGSSGLTPGFFVLLAAGGAVAAVLAVLVLLTLAVVEVAAFDTVVRASQTAELRDWREPLTLTPTLRRRLVARAFALQLISLLAVALAAVPLVVAVLQATLDEILSPASDASIYLRVLSDVRSALFVFIAAFVVIDLFSASAERELLMRASGLRGTLAARRLPAAIIDSARHTLARPFRSPVRTIIAAAVGWVLWLGVAVAVSWTLTFTWQQVEATFLALPGGAAAAEPAHTLALLVVAALLAAVFSVCLFLFGVVSAVRAALWSVAGLR